MKRFCAHGFVVLVEGKGFGGEVFALQPKENKTPEIGTMQIAKKQVQ